MVFKLVSGVHAVTHQLWSSMDSLNEDKTEALNTNSAIRNHYKNRMVANWQTVNLSEVNLQSN